MGGLGPALYGADDRADRADPPAAAGDRRGLVDAPDGDRGAGHGQRPAPPARATVLGGYYMLSQELGGLAAPALGILSDLFGLGTAYSGAAIAMALMSVLVVLIGRKL